MGQMRQPVQAEPVVVSVDIGTSGARAAAFDGSYQVRAGSTRRLTTSVGSGGQSAQSWREIADATISAVREVAKSGPLDVRAISLSGTASNLAVSGSAGGAGRSRDLGEVILWSDRRAAGFVDGLDEKVPPRERFSRTLCPADFSYWPAKLLWAGGQEGSGFRRCQFGGAKDYFFELLTGCFWVDPMTAAATGIFDSEKWEWDQPLLAALHLDPHQLPSLHLATDQAPVLAELAQELGVPDGTPVVVGGMDGPLAQLGACGFSTDVHTCTAGTSVAYRAGVRHRTVDPAERLWCYPVDPGFWVVGGAGSNGGNVLDWLAATIGRGDGARDVAALVSEALAAEPDPGLIFLPYLNGERAPLWRDDLRAAVVGLAAHHGGPDIVRAALDGVGAALLELSGAVTEVTGVPSDVSLTGGFLQDDKWPQLVTDFLGRPTSVPDPQIATSTGAAVIAWLSLGEAGPRPPGPARATQHRLPDAAAHTELVRKTERARAVRTALYGDKKAKNGMAGAGFASHGP